MVDATTIIDYNYDDFLVGIDHIAKSVSVSGWKPDFIVGVVRGGAVPAVYLSHRLKIPVQMVHWSSRDVTEWSNETNCWIPEEILAGKNVLVVDDIVDGGDTIRELLEDWQKSVRDPLPATNIKVAAMYYNTSQDVVVDYYHLTIDRNEDQRWVIFPWEA